MRLVLVHHADALGPEIDPQRPLSSRGLAEAAALAARASADGLAPAAIWHSGKLRARQTAEAFLRVCSPFAEFRMVHGLRPEDPPQFLRRELALEERDVMAVGHMPNLSSVLWDLVPESEGFPLHGLVVLDRTADGYVERWRATPV
jgi:phosphohistidine phosphatase